jgi:hypothetical protein
MKTCKDCKECKPLKEYGKKKDNKDGYRASCKVCSNKKSKAWYEANKEKRLAKSREWNANNKERRRINNNNWWRNNPDKRLSKFKRFHKNNLSKNRQYVAKRRAAKLQRTPPWLTEDQLWLINEIYDLAALRTEVTGVEHHVDHVVPLQGNTVSGLHLPWNLQVLTAYENLSKSNLI